MNIPKAAGREALVLVLSETKAQKAKAKERGIKERKEKAEAHPENKVTVASGAAKVLAVEKAPALTNMTPTSAVVRQKEKEKGKEKGKAIVTTVAKQAIMREIAGAKAKEKVNRHIHYRITCRN